MIESDITINNAMKYAINLFAIKLLENNKQIGKYLLIDICGVGSNGVVCTVKNIENNKKFALKLLNLSYYIINTFHLDINNFHKSVFLNIKQIQKEINETHYEIRDLNKELISHFNSCVEEKSFKREFVSLNAIPKNNHCVFLEDYGILQLNATNGTDKSLTEIPYIIMPIFSGITLTDYIENSNCFSKDYNKIFEILKDITEITKFIHNNNIIHRDLYSNNFLYDETTKSVFLLDFGSALYNKDLSFEIIGERRGSRRFMSPEQFRNPQSVDFRSDYFFLGSLLFYMLTQTSPFTRERNANTLPKAIQNFLYVKDFKNNIELYKKIVFFTNKLLEYNANDRFQNIIEIEEKIDEILKLI